MSGVFLTGMISILLLLLPEESNGQGVPADSSGTDIVLFDLGWTDRGQPELLHPVRITNRAGYDNQPSFAPDGSNLLYASIREGQSDIFRYTVTTGSSEALTQTTDSEFSPRYAPDGTSFFYVRVELPDSLQRLWRWDPGKNKPRLMMDMVEPVGYYTWINEQIVAVFVLGIGDKNTLQSGYASRQKMQIIAPDIGRCLALYPGKEMLTFVVNAGTPEAMIRTYTPDDGRVQDLTKALPEAQDFAWTPEGVLLMASGTRLYYFEPSPPLGRDSGDGRWHFGTDLREILPMDWHLDQVSRLAVSPDGQRIAVVLERVH